MSEGRRLSRRRLLAAGVMAGAAPLAGGSAPLIRGEVPWQEGAADAPRNVQGGRGYQFFTAAEAAFVETAVARLIPNDDLGPGALEAGVPVFIDRQLAGNFGRGGHWYMQGPWEKGLPTQGYQTRMTPAAMYRAAIRAIDQAVARQGRAGAFAKLEVADRDAILKGLEDGKVQLGGGVDPKAFFDMLLQNTVEGFWSDPMYGGNRGMAGWKLIGFPGARYDHSPFVTQHGKAYPLPPVGLAGRPAWTRG